MNIFSKKSLMQSLLQVGIMASAIVVPGPGALLAQIAKPISAVSANSNPEASKILGLLQAGQQELEQNNKAAPRQKNIDKKDQMLKKAIEQMDVFAQKEKDRSIQKTIEKAVKAVMEARYAIKSKIVTESQIGEALVLLDRVVEKVSNQAQAIGSDRIPAIRGLQELLDDYSHQMLVSMADSRNSDPCKKQVTVIQCLPIIITRSGSYCLAKDFCVTESCSGAAITVKADNVNIDFSNHTIVLSDALTGISAQGVSNLIVHNGTIDCGGKALSLDKVTSASFKNMIFCNNSIGASLTACVDQLFVNCKFVKQFFGINLPCNGFQTVTLESCEFGQSCAAIQFTTGGPGVLIHNCKFLNQEEFAIGLFPLDGKLSNVEISDCEFASTNTGIVLGVSNIGPTPIVNTEIRNCSFANMDGNGVNGQNYTNLRVEDCLFQGSSENAFNLFQLGNFGATDLASDAIVRNCTFNCQQPQPNFDGIIFAGQGILLENCVIDTNAASAAGYVPANVQISGAFSSGNQATDGIRLVKSIIRNQSGFGIHSDGSSLSISPTNVEIDNCLIDGAFQAGVFFDNASTSTIKNCEIIGTVNGPGISVANGSQFITMWNNTVVNNSAQGIVVDAKSSFNSLLSNRASYNGSDGLAISSSKNMVKSNTISHNFGNGIFNTTGDVTNLFCNNSAGNNWELDCVGIPSGLIGHPADPAVSCGNICGTP